MLLAVETDPSKLMQISEYSQYPIFFLLLFTNTLRQHLELSNYTQLLFQFHDAQEKLC